MSYPTAVPADSAAYKAFMQFTQKSLVFPPHDLFTQSKHMAGAFYSAFLDYYYAEGCEDEAVRIEDHPPYDFRKEDEDSLTKLRTTTMADLMNNGGSLVGRPSSSFDCGSGAVWKSKLRLYSDWDAREKALRDEYFERLTRIDSPPAAGTPVKDGIVNGAKYGHSVDEDWNLDYAAWLAPGMVSEFEQPPPVYEKFPDSSGQDSGSSVPSSSSWELRDVIVVEDSDVEDVIMLDEPKSKGRSMQPPPLPSPRRRPTTGGKWRPGEWPGAERRDNSVVRPAKLNSRAARGEAVEQAALHKARTSKLASPSISSRKPFSVHN